MDSKIFIARQPIFDRNLACLGYELLFRSGDVPSAGDKPGDMATAQVLLQTFIDVGLDELVGNKIAFLNLTRDFLRTAPPLGLPPNRVAIEVLETVAMDESLTADVHGLAELGYPIVLDDFVYREEARPLIAVSSIVKLDVLALGREKSVEFASQIKAMGKKVLAEKVETQDELTYFRNEGFDYFQGYFLARPNIVTNRRMPVSRAVAVRLLAKVQNPAVTLDELEEIIRQDVTLSYRVLRTINSAAFGLRQKVDSVKRALMMLGIDHLRNCLSLLVMSGFDDKPRELMTVALVRARMCETLALEAKADGPAGFTAGLFSVLDAFMDRPLPEVLAALPLAPTLVEALLNGRGSLGRILRVVLAYESGEFDMMFGCGFQPSSLLQAYLEALHWADETQSSL